MPRKKKPVDRTPICDPAYLRRIDPVWMPGPVPPRFWEEQRNRRDYLCWSAHRLGFRTMQDLYRLQLSVCYERNYGAGLIVYWEQSALEAVQDCFPEYDWQPWLFAEVSNGFWDSRANRRSYMAWLGRRLGYRRMDDWYEVGQNEFLRNRGAGILQYYRGSAARAVIDLVPGRNWCEWKFRRVPPGFWEVMENRHRYLRWVGKDLGYRRPEDWYQIRHKDLTARHGVALLQKFSSLYDIMREFLPELEWDRVDVHQPIRIEQVLAWADAHHTRHGEWPTCESGEIPGTVHTWDGINGCLRGGFRGLPGRTTLAKFLAKHRDVRVGRKPPNLSESQVLAWADAFFAAHGKWPTQKSGPIPGTRETWNAITLAMYVGGRGFRRGSSLAQLLARQRGARNHLRLPPLEEHQILKWARAYYKMAGRWPTNLSGPIEQASGETWGAVNHALGDGARGLPGGSSLAKLLRKHRLK